MQMHQDENIVNRIVDMKTRSNEYKEHPDSPGDLSATLFYVLIDMDTIDEDEHADQLSLSVSGDARGEQAPPICSFKGHSCHEGFQSPCCIYWTMKEVGNDT